MPGKVKRPSVTRRTMGWYWYFARRYPKQVAGSLLRIVDSAALTIIIPFLISRIVQLIAQDNFAPIIDNLTLIVITAAVGIATNYTAVSSLSRMEAKAQRDLNVFCFDHLMSQGFSFFSNRFAGSLVNQVSKFGGSMVRFWDAVVMDILGLLVSVVFASAVLAWFNLGYAAVTFVTVLISIAVIVWMTIKRIPYRRRAVRAVSKVTGELADNLTNAMAVKSFAAETRESKRYFASSDDLANKQLKSWIIAIKNGQVIIALGIILELIVLFYGVNLVQRGLIELEIFLVAQIYAMQLAGRFWQMSGIARSLEGAFADAHEMVELLKIKPAIQDRPKTQPSRISRGTIHFDHIDFRYQDERGYLFRDLSFEIEPGQRVGMVGHSGSGKTTITKLLLRFHDVNRGAITIDGQDIRHIKQRDLRQAITYVPQEPLLFHRSIAENIGYSKPAASLEEIKQAAQMAYADEFIEALPDGYDTLVGERGVKLSGGQKQRVAIARAILKDSPILVFDEATSALDSTSEAAIQKAMANVMEDHTSIVIAHRLSTIQKLDRIIVFEEGHMAEDGTHQQLLASGGIYKQLWDHQSGGFID